MRGDQKWPPQSVKEAVAAENEARMMLAKGPACRPRKVTSRRITFYPSSVHGQIIHILHIPLYIISL